MHASATVQARNGGASAPLRRLGVAALLVLVPLVLLITLWPTHALMRFKPTVVRGLTWLHDRGVVEWLTWVRLEVLANVAMLIPVGFALACLLGGRRWLIAVAMCAGLSLAVETVQWAMPGRIASPLDVVMNTIGALIGVGLVVLIESLLRRRRARAATRDARDERAAPAR